MGNFARQVIEFPNRRNDPYRQNVVLYSRMEDDPPIDVSSSAHTITKGSGATTEAVQFKFGAASFDLDNTSNGYLEIASDPDFLLGAGPFTMEGWVRYEENPSGSDDIILFSVWSDSGDQRSYRFRLFNGGTIRFSYSVDGTSTLIHVDAVFDPAADIWYHYAITRDEDGIVRIFVDGVIIGSGSIGTDVFFDSTAALRIGVAVDDAGSDGQQYVDETRITKGVCRYKEDFTVQKETFSASDSIYDSYSDPFWDHVVLQTDFETKDIPVDSSTRKHTLTLGSGGSIDTTQSKFGTASLLSDDTTNGYAASVDDDDWNFGGDDFTIECFARWLSTPSADEDLLSHYDTGTSNREWLFIWDNGATMRFFYSTDGSAGPNLEGASFTPSIGQWYHMVFCRNGADGRMFIDGVQSGSTFNLSTDVFFNSTAAFKIGNYDNSSNTLDANIDGVRITKGIARYTTDFTAPVRAFPTVGSDEHFGATTAVVPLNQAAGSYLERGPDSIGVSSDSGVTTELTVANLLFDDAVSDVDATDNGMIVVGDPYWDSVVLLTHMDHTTPIDVSKSAHTLTVSSATRDTSDKKFGASSFTMSDGQWVSAADSADWDLGSGDFTIEAWTFFDGTPSATDDATIVGHYGTSEFSWLLFLENQTLNFDTSTDGDVANNRLTIAWTPSATTWYHVVVCRVGGDLILYIDGAEQHRVANSETLHNSTAELRIGEDASDKFTQRQLNIDDVRITKGVGRYLSSFVPLTRPHSSVMVIPTTGEFTLEGFVRWEADPGVADSIICGQWNEGEDERGWQVYLSAGVNLRFSYSTDGAVGTVVNTDETWNPAADVWYHWAIGRDASDDLWMFIDGTQLGTKDNITATFHDSSAVVTLGETEDHATGSTQLYQAQARFTSGVARYVADFIAPLGPLATQGIDLRDLGSVDVWYDASAEGGVFTDDNADVVSLRDLSGNNRHMANATASERPTVLAKADANAIGNRRTIDFDGSTQLLRVAVSDNRWDGGDLPMTIACAVQASTTPGNDTSERFISFSLTTDADTQMAFGLGDISGTDRWRITRDDDAGAGPTNVDDVTNADTSAHVAVVVFYGTTVDLWIDGVLEVNGTALNLGTMTVDEITLGAHNRNATEGEHADFRLGELVVYDEALGDSAAVVLSNYLMAKWSI